MRAILLLAALGLAGCGGGGGATATALPPPLPVCCDSTALIAADFADAEQAELADFDSRHANITCCNGAALGSMRDNAILAADKWGNSALQTVNHYGQTMDIDEPAVTDLVEDHRLSMLDYMLAVYDDTTSQPAWAGNDNAIAQARQQLIDGVHAEFDQLQTDI